jgi:GTP cyclohydrolase IA
MSIDNRQLVIQKIRAAMSSLYELEAIKDGIDREHIHNSPDRIAKSMLELIEGCWEDPHETLRTVFKTGLSDELIYANSIPFVSICCHHFLPFFGKVYFGYLPDKLITGLSKMPRLVQVYAKRPQIQEKLTSEIVDTFDEILKPKGCGIIIEAYHLCVSLRGVKSEGTYTRTTALRGCFKEGSTKQEFLQGVRKISPQIWP